MFGPTQQGDARGNTTGTLESHVFETDYWCMFVGIEEHLDDVSMQVENNRMDAFGKKVKIRI